jgi:hypothetical protein
MNKNKKKSTHNRLSGGIRTDWKPDASFKLTSGPG